MRKVLSNKCSAGFRAGDGEGHGNFLSYIYEDTDLNPC